MEDLKNFSQSLSPPQFFAAGEYHVLDRAAAALLGNGVERCVVGVAEHREDRRAADLVDGIVAPLAAGDVAAVEGEQLIQFAPVEEHPPRAFAVLTETIELADRKTHVRTPVTHEHIVCRLMLSNKKVIIIY